MVVVPRGAAAAVAAAVVAAAAVPAAVIRSPLFTLACTHSPMLTRIRPLAYALPHAIALAYSCLFSSSMFSVLISMQALVDLLTMHLWTLH
jgi:hypothetical protein